MTKSTILSGTDLSKKYGDLEVVKGVSLAVNEGEFVCLVGKSGCGKTTLLSLLSGLEKPTKGTGKSRRKRDYHFIRGRAGFVPTGQCRVHFSVLQSHPDPLRMGERGPSSFSH